MPRRSSSLIEDAFKSVVAFKRTPSLESTSSLQSLSRSARRVRSLEQSILDFERISPNVYGPNLFDCVACIIFCKRHDNFALSRISECKGMWLPFTVLRPSEPWVTTCEVKLRQILTVVNYSSTPNYLSFSPPEVIHILRQQVPQIGQYLMRIILYVELTYLKDHPQSCCQNSASVTWFSSDKVISQSIPDLWGPEPCVFAEAIIHEALVKGSFTEFSLKDATKYLPRENSKNPREAMLQSANFQEKDVIKLYSDFLQHCYPSQFMVFPSFVDYMSRLGFDARDADLSHIYRSFGYEHMTYISFHELLLGLAAMDKKTEHGGPTGELRCGYIFRFYDFSNSGTLDSTEFARLNYDILKISDKRHDPVSLATEVQKNMALLNSIGAAEEGLNETIFLKAVSLRHLRGTSGLFRCPTAIVQQIASKKIYDSPVMYDSLERLGPKIKGICSGCKTKKYSLALHSVRVTSDGSIVEAQKIDDSGAFEDVIPRVRREASFTAFSSEEMANKFLEWVREFADHYCSYQRRLRLKQKMKKESVFWVQPDNKELLTRAIIKLCEQAENLFKKEMRCIRVKSPCYVLGDTHGNLRDVMIFERILWPKAPVSIPANYLFLGDFVDRGDFGLECVVYLFAFKIINPKKFNLIRGNHEIRNIQRAFTFYNECYEKFNKHANPIWEAINSAFDAMPLCSVIDDSIFCAHGGIPASASKLDELESIPMPLTDPEQESPAAWEMLWNDPISLNEFEELATMLQGQDSSVRSSGFLPNTKRSTAYFYNEDAVNRFLKINHLTHVIRAHEVAEHGHRTHMRGKVITVFSSSHYHNNNEAACIFVNQEKMRIIKLDTSN